MQNSQDMTGPGRRCFSESGNCGVNWFSLYNLRIPPPPRPNTFTLGSRGNTYSRKLKVPLTTVFLYYCKWVCSILLWFKCLLWTPAYIPSRRSDQSDVLQQHWTVHLQCLYISCYVTVNKPVLSYLSLPHYIAILLQKRNCSCHSFYGTTFDSYIWINYTWLWKCCYLMQRNSENVPKVFIFVEVSHCRHIGCLDVCATPQLGTVTLRPALSDTGTIRPMSCCGPATQLQQYD
jgi:hypothetical protein